MPPKKVEIKPTVSLQEVKKPVNINVKKEEIPKKQLEKPREEVKKEEVKKEEVKDYINLKDGTTIGINTIFNKNNTFCNNIGSYIYYYSQSKNKMSLIANIDPLILPIYYPLFYNNYYIKSVYTFIQDNNYIRKEYNNIEWINLINIVKNNYSYLSFPFFTPYLPVIEEYIINLKYN